MNKALFLDRDGIINIDKGYVHKWSEIVWMDGIFDIIKLANTRDYKVIVVTNQAGVDRKMYTHDDVALLHKQMNEYLVSRDLHITDWLYCAELTHESRKPRPGMLLEAREKHQIDLGASFMVGDKVSDVFETDGAFTRPSTLLLKGNYDLVDASSHAEVRFFDSHQKILKVLEQEMK
jgi:D-glycero-D-manno-heptose 1,7-bisphosphate phosphatase